MEKIRFLLLLCITILPALAQVTPLNVFPVGDSITWGFGSEGGYRSPLWFKLAAAGYSIRYQGSYAENPGPGPQPWWAEQQHEGHPGYRSDEILVYLDGFAELASPWAHNGGFWLPGGPGGRPAIFPDIVLLHIGTNDIGQGRGPATPAAVVDQILTKIENLRPNAHTFVATIIPLDWLPVHRPQVEAYNAALRLVVAQHQAQGKKVHIAEINSRFINPDGTTKPGLTYDGIHCTQAGHNLMADGWFETITSVFSPQVPQPPLNTPTLAYYRFEDGAAGTSVYGQNASHSVTDSSGNNFTMVTPAEEASAAYASDKPDTVVAQTAAPNTRSFDNRAAPGSGQSTRFVATPEGSRLNLLPLGSFTLEASFKFNSVGGFQTIVGKESSDGNALADLYFQASAADGNGQSFLRAVVKQPDRSTVAIAGSTPLQAGRWYNAALVANGQEMFLFLHDTVSGARTLEASGGCTGLYQGVSSWTIGRGQFGGNPVDQTNGWIDEVRISNTALLYGSLLQATPGMTGPPTAVSSVSVFDRVPEAANEGYKVLYELNLPSDANWRDANLIPYAVDSSLTEQAFDRVAYYLELANGANSQWVYASMDAFTTVPRQLGMPHNLLNPVKFQQPVTNLNVYTNVAGVVTGHSLSGGHVEMWPSNYAGANGLPTYAAGNGLDWGDSGGDVVSGYGSFQVHNALARQTLFAYNRWGLADGSADDIGIGNRPAAANSDWTFAGNANQYGARKLVILVRPTQNNANTPATTFTAVPNNRAVVPRNVATNTAVVPITGSVPQLSVVAGGFDKAILRVKRNGTQVTQLESALSAANLSFSFSPEITAELASYDFDVLLSRPTEEGTEERLVRHVSDVVAGDVYLFYGQSNAEAARGYSANNQSANGYASPWVRTFGQNADSGVITRNSTWWDNANGDGAGSSFADPAAVGQWALVVGRKIVDDYQIPVAILNGARGGYAIQNLQKDDANPDNLDDTGPVTRTYNRLRYRAIQGGVAAKARALFYYQGEFDFDNAEVHAVGWDLLHTDWQVDYPGLEHIYEVQLRPGCGVTRENVALRQVQRGFGDIYPNVSVMGTNGLQAHDGCHFNFLGGYEMLGLHHYRQMRRDLYGAPNGPNIDALNPARVEFADESRTRITVTMRDPGATINFPSGALTDFALVGTGASIISRTVDGNSFTLKLDQPASGSPVLEYRSRAGAGHFVTNGNDVGLLSFAQPVEPFGPVVTITSPASSQEASGGATLTISALATDGPNGPATRMVFFANGVPQLETATSVLNTTWTVPANGAHLLTVVAYDAAGATGSDNVSVFVTGGGAPGGVAAGLRAWFKAEAGVVKDLNGFVASWQDQSGNANHANQVTSANQPTFADGAFGIGAGVIFDGNDFVTSPTGMPTGSYTKIVRFIANGSGTVHNLISSDAGGSATARDHAFFAPDLRPTIFHSGSQLGAAQPVSSGAQTIAACTFDSSTNGAKVYVNGSLSNTGTLAGPNTIASFQLGAFMNGFNLSGRIAEVIIYDRVLNDGEFNSIFDYLDDKYRTPFGLWLKSNLGSAATMNSDPHSDGLVAAIEYALGLDPASNNAGSPRLPRVVRIGDTVDVTYQRATDRPDAIVELEMSTDLQDWEPVEDDPIGVTGNLETRRYTAQVQSDVGTSFFRLRIRLP